MKTFQQSLPAAHSKLLACLLLMVGSSAAMAQIPAVKMPHPMCTQTHDPRLQLEATSSSEISADTANMQWFVEVSEPDLSSASNKATVLLNDALQKLAKEPAILQKRTQFNTFPNYGKDGKVVGWRARADVYIEGTDFAGLSKAGQKINQTFAIGQVSYRLSDAARAKEEQKLTKLAIEEFRQKAQSAASGFGYAGFDVSEVSIRSGGGATPMYRTLAPMAMTAASAPMPLEGGQSSVAITVSGSVQLK